MAQLDGKRGGSNEMEKYSLCCGGLAGKGRGRGSCVCDVLYCFVNKIAQV